MARKKAATKAPVAKRERNPGGVSEATLTKRSRYSAVRSKREKMTWLANHYGIEIQDDWSDKELDAAIRAHVSSLASVI